MLRNMTQITADIKRCQSQIAATYESHTPQNSAEILMVRQGFQNQLNKLYDEKTQAIRNIEVINPRIVRTDEPEILGV